MDNQVAVKAIIRNQDGKFLIVRAGQRWHAVGGRLDGGEKLEEGLRRETKEETGIEDLNIGRVIHVDEWFAKPEGELKHIVALFFLCTSSTDDVALSDEHEAYAWIDIDELRGYEGVLEEQTKQAIIFAAKSVDG